MLNIKSTHRATTAMREAFENGLRHWVNRQHQKVNASPTIEKVGNSLSHNAGVYRRHDISLNISTKTWNQLKQLKAV